ncbi:MAG: hypothetical protein RLZZ303_2036 [Candidatus Hydrogenedentota bacterium]|jgi:hypothetical protein
MPELLKYQVARVLDQLTRVASPSRRQVNRCLALLRPLLVAAEVAEADIDRFECAVHEALTRGEVLMRLHCARDVRRTVELVLAQELGLNLTESCADWLAGRLPLDLGQSSCGRKWCLKELDNHTSSAKQSKRVPRSRRPDHYDRRLPRGESLSSLNPFTMRTAPPAADHHASDLDREAVDRLLRQLGWGGRDFGPEPPSGGTPARL